MARGTPIRVTPLAALPRFAAAAILAASLVPATPRAQQAPPFTASTNLVVVPAVVVDRSGATVANLTAADFEVTEDGKPVEITTFVPPAAPGDPDADGRFIVLVLDNLYTPAEIAFRVRRIGQQFVDRLGPRDVMSVIHLNGGNANTSNSRGVLSDAVKRFKPAFGDDGLLPGQRADHGLRMLSSLSEQIAAAPHRRKIVVYLGHSALFNPRQAMVSDGPGESGMSPEWREAIRATSRNNVAIYAVDPMGLEGAPGDYAHQFTEETGGAAWSRSNNFKGAIDRIWHDGASYYLLGYAAPINDQRIHQIRVKVARRGVTVRARRARG